MAKASKGNHDEFEDDDEENQAGFFFFFLRFEEFLCGDLVKELDNELGRGNWQGKQKGKVGRRTGRNIPKQSREGGARLMRGKLKLSDYCLHFLFQFWFVFDFGFWI